MERAATSVAVWLDLLVGEEHLHFHPRGISIPETYLSLRVSDLRWKILTHMTAIVLKNVRKTFRRRAEVGFSRKRGERREVLRDITLEVGDGKTFCVLGRNGSGKTTLVRVLSTLIEPDGGEGLVSTAANARTNTRNITRCSAPPFRRACLRAARRAHRSLRSTGT